MESLSVGIEKTDILPLPVPQEDLPPSIGHHQANSNEVPDWSKAAHGDVTLIQEINKSVQRCI